MTFWRKDGKELFYLAADRSIMSVDVGTGATPFGKPRVAVPARRRHPGGHRPGHVQREPRRREVRDSPCRVPNCGQLTVYDRSGKAVNTVPQAGFYNQPHLSPDGDARVVMRNDPQSGNADIWVMELATRQGHPDHQRHVPRERADLVARRQAGGLRVHPRGHLAGIYRKNADGTGDAELVFQVHAGRRHGADRLVV